MSADSEGNQFNPLSDVNPDNVYIAEGGWCGEIYSTDWSADDADMDEDEWEQIKKNQPRVLVLWPI